MPRITLDDPTDFLEWRRASGGTVEIVDIQIGSRRRIGRGTALVKKLLAEVWTSDEIVHVWAVTRSSNEVAQQFYERLGFNVVAVLRRFYDNDRGADAIMYGIRNLP